MTISSTVRIAGPYIGSGAATVFPFAFNVFAAAEMQVAKLNTTSNVETILVLNTDYTVQLNGDQNSNPGGTITTPAVLASGYNLTITSDIANLQPTDLTNQGGFFPEVITDALDRATIQIQQLDQNSRAIKIPLSDGVLDMTTPVVSARQGKYLAFDSFGLPVVSSGTGNDSALRTDLANATAVSAGSRLSGFRQTGTGATARTVDTKLKDTVSVNDFGAVGDGVTDDTVAIQAAVTAAVGKILIAVGTYKTSATINLQSNSSYNFTNATFFCSGAVTYNHLTINGKTNVELIGGNLTAVPGTSPVSGAHPTGTYYGGTGVQIQNSSSIKVFNLSASRLFGAVNVYNSSYVMVKNCLLSDNAGGIQAVSDNAYSGNVVMTGIQFHENIILHSGDDALTFLVRNTGRIFGSSICNNYITKDAGINGTVGQSKAIALYGTFGTAVNAIDGVTVNNNVGYYMGMEFMRVQGVARCNFIGNTVTSYAALGAYNAFQFGDVTLSNLGVTDSSIVGNVASSQITNTIAFGLNAATRCMFTNNYASTSIGGEGCLGCQSAVGCIINENVLHNTLAYGIKLDASSTQNCVASNDLSIFVALSIADLGTANKKNLNRGYISTNQGASAVPAGASTKIIGHGLTYQGTANTHIIITPSSNSFNATRWWISAYAAGTFTITTDANPTLGDFTFKWQAIEVQ